MYIYQPPKWYPRLKATLDNCFRITNYRVSMFLNGKKMRKHVLHVTFACYFQKTVDWFHLQSLGWKRPTIYIIYNDIQFIASQFPCAVLDTVYRLEKKYSDHNNMMFVRSLAFVLLIAGKVKCYTNLLFNNRLSKNKYCEPEMSR